MVGREATGQLEVRIHIPPIYSNMCGWFYEIRTDFFQNVSGVKIWVVLNNDDITCYESPFDSSPVGGFSCQDISKLTQKKFDVTEIKMKGVEIQFKSGNQLYWAWGK